MKKVKLDYIMLFQVLRFPFYTSKMEGIVFRHIFLNRTDGAALLAELRPDYIWSKEDIENANTYLF
jgi:hypothetical protein